MKQKVANILAKKLENLDIRHIFGIIGAGNVHIFEAIAERGFTEIICVHHEQAATMAIQTYYRSCGRIAAALVTTGAGSTNAITGVVGAWADSMPGLVIAGNENSKFTLTHSSMRMWGVQGYDSVEMVKKVTKYSTRVMEPSLIAYELEKAVHISLDLRPGPVWLEIPMDIQAASIEEDGLEHFIKPIKRRYDTLQIMEQVELVSNSLINAARPLLWLGHGIRLSGAVDKIEKLLDYLGIPAIVSWAGIDMVDQNHPLVFGRAGVYGQRAANFILQNSDYVLAIGTRLALPQIGFNLDELARAAEIDVVDIDLMEASKLKPRIRESVVCDAGVFIDFLINRFQSAKIKAKNEWLDRCNDYRMQFPFVDDKGEHLDPEGYINSYTFIDRLNQYLKPDQTIVTDMGTALLSGHQALKIHSGQRLFTSTGLGEMGYGLPGAIGSSIALNHGEVMCLNCDGGMMLNLQELQTIKHHLLPIKIFIFNNDGYLMIKHTQKNLFRKNITGVDSSTGVSCPDFGKLASVFDMPAFQIRTWDDFYKYMPEIQLLNEPLICEVFMDPMQLFTPKLGFTSRPDGTLVSSPLEDLSPLLDRETLKNAMIIDVHPKSLI